MTKTTLLKESTATPLAKSGNHWRAVLVTPGKGSSGTYSEAMLKEYGPKAFPKGTHSYVGHPNSEYEQRDPKNLMGVLAEDAYWEEGVGVVGKLDIMPHWKDFVEAVAPHTGLSIYAMGSGNDESGEMVVESLIPAIDNSVDLVSYPGRPGSGLAEKLYESARRAFVEKRTEDVSGGKEGNDMTVEEQLAKLTTLVTEFISESKEAAAKLVQEQANAATAADEVSVKVKATIEALELVHDAKLSDPLEAELVSAVEAGNTDVKPLIERAKGIEKAIAESLSKNDDENLRINESSDKSKATKLSGLSIFAGDK